MCIAICCNFATSLTFAITLVSEVLKKGAKKIAKLQNPRSKETPSEMGTFSA